VHQPVRRAPGPGALSQDPLPPLREHAGLALQTNAG
jgi:hypothetical protein